MKKLINFIGGFFTSKSNESSKRLIAILFSSALIIILFLFCGAVIWLLYYGKDISKIKDIIEQIITTFAYLIGLLLGFNMIENLSTIFKKEN